MRVLAELGKDLTQLPTLATNRENVHVFDASVTQFLLELGGIKLATVSRDGQERVRTFDDVVELIRAHPRYASSQDAINSSLLRIRIDQLLYPGSQSLTTIFLRIFNQIERHAEKELLMERLLDELIDMADTCSTGHASRLVNVFSGIDGFFMRMNWRDQIQANISGRLTARAKVAKDLEARARLAEAGIVGTAQQLETIDAEFRDRLLAEMLNPKVEDRTHWNEFLRDVIGPLRAELTQEFVTSGLVGPDDFDLWFRQGMLFFEVGVRE
jgi:hypothetical protein